ncbi:MAG: transglutaminase domain-containing protein [Armatimonadetes bacterium]|nr:transglutaminase domain-containing protein [Armatimonadota bacterium]
MRLRIPLTFLVVLCLSVAGWADEAWMGLYMKGEKIGYTGAVTSPDKLDGKAVTKSYSVMVLSGTMLGGDLDMKQEITSWISAAGRPIKSVITSTSSGRLTKATASFSAKEIKLKITNGDTTTDKILAIEPTMTLVDDPVTYVLEHRPNAKSTTVHVLDPTTFTLVPTQVKVMGKKKVAVGANEFTADLIQIVDPRATMDAYFTSKGDLVKLTGPFGMEFLPEPKTIAMDLSKRGNVDLAEAAAVKVEKPIENIADLSILSLEVTGLDLAKLPSDKHQTIAKSGSGWTITIHPTTDPHPTSIAKASAAQPAWTKPSMLIPSGNPEMKALAKKVVGGATSVPVASEKLRQHVYSLMRPNTGIGVLRDATEVLKSKEGLCRDHAVLLTTLLRSAGIPARLASGLIYESGAFYYHAWSEAWMGSQWVGLDSTRPSPHLSVGHLKLAQGNVDEAFMFIVLDGAKIVVKGN